MVKGLANCKKRLTPPTGWARPSRWPSATAKGAWTLPVYPEAHLKTWKLKGWTESGTENAEGSVLFGPHQVQVLKTPAQPRLFLAGMRYQSPKGLPKDKIDEQAVPLLKRLKL